MRLVICCMSLVATSLVMVGCGQSGALQLPSDINHDKRAKYLIYSDTQHSTKQANTKVKSVEESEKTQ